MKKWTLYKSATKIKTIQAEYLYEAIALCSDVFTEPKQWADLSGCHQWCSDEKGSFAYELVLEE